MWPKNKKCPTVVLNSRANLLRSLVNWRIFLKLFSNLENDLVCLQGYLFSLRDFNFVQVNSKRKAYNISCNWNAVNLECHVPLISLSDYLNGGTCVRQHFPIFSIFVKIFLNFLPDLSIQGTPIVVRYSSNPSLFSCTKVPTALSIAFKCSLRRPGMGPHRTLQIGWNFYNAEIW